MRCGAALLAACAALAAGAAGCGVGAGGAPSGVELKVTTGFGQRAAHPRRRPRIDGADTVMRLLQRNAKVTTRFGGGFVQSIDGLAGGRDGGAPVDWFYYVNGIEARKGATATKVHDGDHLWWDRRDWSATQDVPAVVGSFPEPFVHGTGGKRLPVRVECADPSASACKAVQGRLTRLGLVAAIGTLSASRSVETLRVVVGPWARVAGDAAVGLIGRGPGGSGVYARFAQGGRALQLLGPDGRVRRTAGAGTGLVAAVRVEGEQPVWALTGTDRAGVDAAVAAFDEGTLEDKYAVAVVDDAAVALPVQPAVAPGP